MSCELNYLFMSKKQDMEGKYIIMKTVNHNYLFMR